MACETLYVKSVRKAVNTATRQWELRGDGCAFNKLWLTHHEAAEHIARTTFGSDHTDVPLLIRKYYRMMATAVRKRMAIKRIDCAAARRYVSTNTLERRVGGTDKVKSCARRAAAYLIGQAGDAWVHDRSVLYSGVSIGGEPLWHKVVRSATTAAKTALASRRKCHEIPALFGGFFSHFMADAHTRRTTTNLSWGVVKKRLAARILASKDMPKDPVKAAAYTAAALLLAAIPDGPSSADTVTTSKSSAVRSEPRRALAPAAATAAVRATVRKESPTPTASANPASADTGMMPPPTRVSRTSWASCRYGRPGPVNATRGVKSAENAVGVGDSANGRQSTTGLPMTPVLKCAAEVTAGGAGVTARPYSSSLPHRTEDAPEYGTSENTSIKLRKTPPGPGAAPETVAATEALGTGSPATATGPTPFSADQGVGALGSGSGSYGLDVFPGNTSVASGAAPAAVMPAAAAAAETARDWDSVLARISSCYHQQPLEANASVEPSMSMLCALDPAACLAAQADATLGESVAEVVFSALLDDFDVVPDDSEACGMEPDVPVASEPTWTANSSSVNAGAGMEGAASTMAALPAPSRNRLEMFGFFLPPTSSGRETMGITLGPEYPTGRDVHGPTDGGGDNSALGTKRKAEDSGNEGEIDDYPCNGGPRKKAHSG